MDFQFLNRMTKYFMGAVALFVGTQKVYALTYCDARGSNVSYEYIKEVKVNGVVSASGGNLYNLFASPKLEAKVGANTIELNPGFGYGAYSESWIVFIDYNRDGIFSLSERAYSGTSNQRLIGSFSVPSTALTGETRMRVAMQYGSVPAACGTFVSGEVEDYTINITNSVVTTPTPKTYCDARSLSADFEHINEVNVNGVKSVSGAGLYNLFASPKFSAKVGSNTIELNPGFSSGSWLESWKVFIDYNQDGIFSDAEQAFAGASKQRLIGSFSVPSTALTGETRMRVAMQYSTPPSACGNIFDGEVEDYIVKIGTQIDASVPVPVQSVLTGIWSGFIQPYGRNLVVTAKFTLNGAAYKTVYFFDNGMAYQGQLTVKADQGTDIELSASVYLENTSTIVPLQCSNVSAGKCIVKAGAFGEKAIFADPNVEATSVGLPPSQIPTSMTQLMTFEKLFGLQSSALGPVIQVDGITIQTASKYFFNQTGAPFTSSYLSNSSMTMYFGAPVQSISFEYAGNCSGCTNLATIYGDGKAVDSFKLESSILSKRTVTFAVPVTSVLFGGDIRIDNLVINYK